MRSLVKQYQIGMFLAITLIIGWFPWYTGRGSIIFAAPMVAALGVAFLRTAGRGL